jgi:hypothetical protein
VRIGRELQACRHPVKVDPDVPGFFGGKSCCFVWKNPDPRYVHRASDLDGVAPSGLPPVIPPGKDDNRSLRMGQHR